MATAADLTQLAAQLAQLASSLATQNREPEPPQVVREMPERILLTTQEAADRLGIGRTLMFRLIRSGEIESVQIGRLRRIPVSAIREYAERLVTNSAEKSAA